MATSLVFLELSARPLRERSINARPPENSPAHQESLRDPGEVAPREQDSPLQDSPLQDSPLHDAADAVEATPAGISIVVFEDTAHQGKSISAARSWFLQQNIPVEFIIVSTQGPRLAPLAGSRTASVNNLAAAIRSARHEHLAIMDASYEFDAAHWKIIDPDQKVGAIRSWSYRPTRAPGSRKILVWIYCWIVSFLLGVKKNRICPGMVTFSKSVLDGINLHRLDLSTADSVSQLLAVAKLHGQRVEEHCADYRHANLIWEKKNSADPHLPRSQSLNRSIERSLQFWFSELAFPARRDRKLQSLSPWYPAVCSALILLVGSILLLSNLGYPLLEPDETRNAQLAMNIVETGQWFSLSLQGEPYWDKPPLLAWMTAISYRCFGYSEWATRLPSALTSLLLLALMLYAGSKLLGFRSAALGTVAMLLAWGFSFQSRYTTMDALLTTFSTVALLGTAIGVSKKETSTLNRTWLTIAGCALGLGTLAKGPICLVLTAPPLVVWMVLNREISSNTIRKAMKCVAIPAALIGLPWFAVTIARNPAFAWYFLWKHHVVRFSDAFNHLEPFWYYVPILWLFMFPASILLPRVVHAFASRKPGHRLNRTPVHGLFVMSAVWIIAFFSMSQCKLPAYILPAFPLIALLTGVVINAELQRCPEKPTRFDRLPKRIAIGTCLLSAIVVVTAIYPFGHIDTGSLTGSGLAVAGCIALALVPVKQNTSRNASWLATAGICMVFVCLGVNHLVPAIATGRSILNAIAETEENSEAIPVIYFGRDSFASMLYLKNRKVIQLDEDSLATVTELLQNNPRATIVASDENIRRIKGQLGSAIRIEKAAARHTFHAATAPSRIASDRSSEPANK